MEIALSRSALAALLVMCWMSLAGAQEACQPVADQIRRDGVPHIAPANQMSLKDAVPASFQPSPALRKALAGLAGGRDYLSLRHFGQGALHSAMMAGDGSANCQSFVFFQVAPDGRAELIEQPPVIVNGQDGKLMFCTGFGVHSYVGEAGGEPAFIVDIDRDQDEEIRITPWRDGAWQKECSVAVHYDATFTVDERYCQGVDCEAFGAWAREIVMRYDKNPEIAAQLPKPDDRYTPLLSGQAELPTFGKSSPSQQDFADEPTVAWELVHDDKHYIARIGHGGIGWRKYPDYVLALYRPDGDKLVPVAGIRIAKSRGKPLSVTVK
jgi:hypothetical protein